MLIKKKNQNIDDSMPVEKTRTFDSGFWGRKAVIVELSSKQVKLIDDSSESEKNTFRVVSLTVTQGYDYPSFQPITITAMIPSEESSDKKAFSISDKYAAVPLNESTTPELDFFRFSKSMEELPAGHILSVIKASISGGKVKLDADLSKITHDEADMRRSVATERIRFGDFEIGYLNKLVEGRANIANSLENLKKAQAELSKVNALKETTR